MSVDKISERQRISLLKTTYTKGMRLRLYNMKGENLPYGLEGTVTKVNDFGQIYMNWDNGSTLAINTDLDNFSVIQ